MCFVIPTRMISRAGFKLGVYFRFVNRLNPDICSVAVNFCSKVENLADELMCGDVLSKAVALAP